MKTLSNISSNDLIKKGLKLSVFLSVAFFAVAVRAQSINDGIEPKKTGGGQTRPVKTVRPTKTRTPRGPYKKPPIKISQPAADPHPVKQTETVQPVVPPTPAVVTPAAVVEPTQTPGQIMERFMNFQQSAGVTAKDWESVVAQTQSDSTDPQAKAQHFIAQGQLAYSRADYSSALVHFNSAAQVMPKSALPFYSIGKVYLITKQPNQAQDAFEKAIKLNKKFALAYQGMGDAMTALKKNKKAQDYYEEAGKIGAGESGSQTVAPSDGNVGGGDVKNADPTTLSADSAYAVELKGARVLTAQKKWQSSLDKLMSLAKTNPTTDVYIAVGDNYFGLEQWLSALQAYRKATELNSSSALGFFKTGMALFETNEFQSAAEAFEKSLILDQNGMSINRQKARKMADQASEKAKDMQGKGKIKKKSFLGIY